MHRNKKPDYRIIDYLQARVRLEITLLTNVALLVRIVFGVRRPLPISIELRRKLLSYEKKIIHYGKKTIRLISDSIR